ncbi:MAG: F0F1 ATP synthase subunit A [Gemmatimonadaceae bacterium]
MKSVRSVRTLALSLLLAGTAALPARAPHGAQEHGAAPAAHSDTDSSVSATVSKETHGAAPEEHGAAGASDIITPHITDSRYLDYPCLNREHGFACEYELPQWAPIHIGGVELDISPTKHVVWMLIAATVCAVVLVSAAAAHRRHSHEVGRPRGFAAGVEAVVLYLRDQVVLRNVGPHGEKYVPFILTLFFFILFANLFGLIPYGSTATGNISVTATLALITFLVVEIAGARALGTGYLSTIFYWNKDLPIYMRIPMFLIMSPVEFIGKFTKPFALAIRLFANMTAGHVVVLALIGLIFTFPVVFFAPLVMSIAIMLLELFVAFLQAFIFSLLASVFIGQIRSAHH